MFPHERSLVERYQNRPFVVLGVNLDVDPSVQRRCEERDQLNWRSWHDGPGSPIATAWQVAMLPTVYLIDHKGMIRFRSAGAPDEGELDRKVEMLVKEAE
jgi:hypothetical protein